MKLTAFRVLLASLVLTTALNPLFADAQRSKRSRASDPCLEYNQGMRVTSNKEWPAAVDRAQRAISELRSGVLVIAIYGPEEFNKLMSEARTGLDTQIKRAGECYPGSLFERIALDLEAELAKLDERAAPELAEWEQREAKRLARQAAWENVPRKLKMATSGSVEIVLERIEGGYQTTVELRVTNTHDGLILRPRTAHVVWLGEGEENERAAIVPTGFSLTDDFGNTFPLKSVKPELTGTEQGIHPATSRTITVVFNDHPPASASTVTLVVDRGTLGNPEALRFSLPAEAFR